MQPSSPPPSGGPAQALGPIESSPLKVRHRDGKFLAEDAALGLVFLGTPGGSGPLDAMTIQTANGTWHIQRRAESSQDVLDQGGRSVATLHRRMMRSTLIELPGGESIPVTTGRLRIFGMGCRVGNLAAARAPFFRPGRYFTLTLRDDLLSRPDKELLVAVGAYVADRVITALIQAAATSQSP